MTDPFNPQTPSKPFPTWAKVLIALAIFGFLFLAAVGVGLKFLGDYLASGGGKELIEKGVQKAVELGIEHSGQNQNGKPDVDFSFGDKGIVVKDQNSGEEFSIKTDTEVPADFPKDITIYSPSKVLGSMAMGPMHVLTLESPDSVQTVFDFYQDQMQKNGWNTQTAANVGDGSFTGLYQKDQRQVTLTVTPDASSQTTVVLSHSKQ